MMKKSKIICAAVLLLAALLCIASIPVIPSMAAATTMVDRHDGSEVSTPEISVPDVPVSSEEPVSSEPEAPSSQEPESSEAPAPSEDPEPSQEPESSQEPVPSEAPASSQEPESIPEPVYTPEPVSSEEPVWTPAPQESSSGEEVSSRFEEPATSIFIPIIGDNSRDPSASRPSSRPSSSRPSSSRPVSGRPESSAIAPTQTPVPQAGSSRFLLFFGLFLILAGIAGLVFFVVLQVRYARKAKAAPAVVPVPDEPEDYSYPEENAAPYTAPKESDASLHSDETLYGFGPAVTPRDKNESFDDYDGSFTLSDDIPSRRDDSADEFEFMSDEELDARLAEYEASAKKSKHINDTREGHRPTRHD